MSARLLLGGTRSGCGKTTFTCALLRSWERAGLRLVSCKSGPDYIDPLFHRSVLGTKSRNLDLFFTDCATTRALLRQNSAGCDLALLEGAMGYYDGIALSSEASAWALSRATETPAVLVVDARGAAASLCAEVEGFLRHRPDSGLRGVLLNRASPTLYPRLRAMLRERCGVEVFGYLPPLPQCAFESRHLGLLTPEEITDFREKLDLLAETARRTVDLDALLALARTAPPLADAPLPLPEPVRGRPVVAVAHDRAFCFHYEENDTLLEALGGEIRTFSPLNGDPLPPCDALWLGGGYPELYAEALSGNRALWAQVRAAVADGLPTVAECGGFLCLQSELETAAGQRWPMAGVFPGRAFPTLALRRFGYVTLTARRDNLLCRAGERFPAHEFHHWDVTDPGGDFSPKSPSQTGAGPASTLPRASTRAFPTSTCMPDRRRRGASCKPPRTAERSEHENPERALPRRAAPERPGHGVGPPPLGRGGQAPGLSGGAGSAHHPRLRHHGHRRPVP